MYRSTHPVVVQKPVHIEKLASGPGRPRKVIDEEWLATAVSPRVRLNISQIARKLHVHRETVRTYLSLYDIDTSYSDISDVELDKILCQFKLERLSAGFSLVQTHLRVFEIKIQPFHFYHSIKHIDGLGGVLRNNPSITQWVYDVPRCNYLWHIDGYYNSFSGG